MAVENCEVTGTILRDKPGVKVLDEHGSILRLGGSAETSMVNKRLQTWTLIRRLMVSRDPI